MRVTPWRRPTLQAALGIGFALVVGLWAYTGYEFTTRMAGVEDASTKVTARYFRAQDRLASVRSQVLVASVHVRDALLEPDRALLPRYEAQIEAIYTGIDRTLSEYEPVLGIAAEREQADRLRKEVESFRQMSREVLATTQQRTLADLRALLTQNLVPRREAAIRVSEEVQTLNRAAFIQHQTDIADIHRAASRRTWQQVGLALVLSLGVALLSSVYAGRLESRLLRQMQTNQDTTRQLQHLSTRLISAQEEERRNVSRELHDEVGQALTAVQVELSVAQRRLKGAGHQEDVLGDAVSITQATLQTVRDISQLLHPSLLDDLGLAAAVEWQVKSLQARHDITVTFDEEGLSARLPRDIELAAYRIVQEALTNVAKHSAASHCRVSLRRQDAQLEITVEDDGAGFDVAGATTSARGLGLVGMRERAALLSGRLALESGTQRGTRVSVRLPVSGRAYG